MTTINRPVLNQPPNPNKRPPLAKYIQ